MKKSLDFIYKQQKELSIFGGIGALLGWDQMTYMPKSGAQERAEQSALISRLAHERVVSDVFWKHIKNLSKLDVFESLSEKDKIVVKRLKKDVEKSRKIPSDFVQRFSKTTTIAYQSWEKARNKSNFKLFSKDLQKIIELEKEYCKYIDIKGHLYDNLLDDYEEGMNTKKLKNEFNFLKRELKNILQKITESDIYQSQKELQLKINKNAQQKIGKLVLERLDLPDDRFRMDVSTHPFTTSMGYDDVRITTSYERENGLFSFFSTIHEAGHALYELGLPKNEYKNTVISDSPSLGLHESQSRFWENMIARNKNFWSCFYPEFKKILKNDSLDELYKNVNQVKPSLIRVEADELTYCLHVILRFEIEVGLIEDRIKISELPEIWNEKMKNILGISPNNDKDGVLQDMHWSGGSFGYFPTYAIGSIYASQIFNQMKKENKDLESEIKNGNFENILLWLKKNIHIYGRMINSDEIIKRCCKEGLKSKIFIDYLKKKYFEIYEI